MIKGKTSSAQNIRAQDAENSGRTAKRLKAKKGKLSHS